MGRRTVPFAEGDGHWKTGKLAHPRGGGGGGLALFVFTQGDHSASGSRVSPPQPLERCGPAGARARGIPQTCSDDGGFGEVITSWDEPSPAPKDTNVDPFRLAMNLSTPPKSTSWCAAGQSGGGEGNSCNPHLIWSFWNPRPPPPPCAGRPISPYIAPLHGPLRLPVGPGAGGGCTQHPPSQGAWGVQTGAVRTKTGSPRHRPGMANQPTPPKGVDPPPPPERCQPHQLRSSNSVLREGHTSAPPICPSLPQTMCLGTAHAKGLAGGCCLGPPPVPRGSAVAGGAEHTQPLKELWSARGREGGPRRPPRA